MIRRILNLSLVASAVMSSGCATMYVHGNHLSTSAEVDGRNTALRVLNFENATPDLRIFEGDRELPLMAVPDHIIANNLRNYMAQEEARAGCGPGTCVYSWTETRAFGPGLWLDKDRPHTLRFVRGGQEATVTVKRRFKVGWVFANWVWFTFAPVGWVVDGATGSWNTYPRLDINALFRTSGRPASLQ